MAWACYSGSMSEYVKAADITLYTHTSIAAKSINFHLREDDDLPIHTATRIDELRVFVEFLNITAVFEENPDTLWALATHYEPVIQELTKFAAHWDEQKDCYRASGGDPATKMSHPTPYQKEHSA